MPYPDGVHGVVPKFCKDCKHAREYVPFHPVDLLCHHPAIVELVRIDPVQGREGFGPMSCSFMREDDRPQTGHLCGSDGKLWEPRVTLKAVS